MSCFRKSYSGMRKPRQPIRVFSRSSSLTLPTPYPGKSWNGESRDLEKMNGSYPNCIYTQAKEAKSKGFKTRWSCTRCEAGISRTTGDASPLRSGGIGLL
ncbi:hypothetical protein CI238_01728 [Colletotrichum incanum]|uniref:Uncharacterized protein n=1 Tax=Colletotrichum incanum TaxID=1573173 RepID=A0A167BXF5_COLIC|nr:hypothetical protein CI238_01728 [Colletotrichum incanum]